MTHKIFGDWAGITWMLLGIPCAVVLVALDVWAIHIGAWSDPWGWTGGVAVLVGMVAGGALFWLLAAILDPITPAKGRR